MTTSFPRELERLVDVEAIRTLKYRYAALCDQDYPRQELKALFTDDAVWDGGIFGVHSGREAIGDFFAGSAQAVEFAMHYIVNPLIEVDGDRAMGSWMLWQSVVLRENKKAYWLMGRYQDTYARIEGEWKFAHVTLKVESLTPYDEGPGKVLIAALE